MKKIVLILGISLIVSFHLFSQDHSFYSSYMTVERCGSDNSGTTKPIENYITIHEAENTISIYFAEGGSALEFKIASVKPSDAAYGITAYKVQTNDAGVQTVLLDRDAQRELLILLRKDKFCTIYGPLRKNK